MMESPVKKGSYFLGFRVSIWGRICFKCGISSVVDPSIDIPDVWHGGETYWLEDYFFLRGLRLY